ncbi:hypothetical protein BDP55DRAFT_754199 [Colletotrichum godetiae]|uniref:Uncharacterized protein n=1 Tax=Colletotrichum godetiae TaxID=1209918 RepID=A0AAJ0AD73_9PEZI|nr:uncharacterized protein BDP55DRAFT_754199 [Colletotrichum godetiae]KAK1671135.1 hypothetical protein BDP55DRAFT_754199 [Colletotrichum godetiae]
MTITKRGFMGLPFLAYMASDSPIDVANAVSARDELDSWAHRIRQYKPAKSMFDLIRSCSSWIHLSQLDSSLEGLTQVKLAHAVHETLANANFEWWATSCRYKVYEEDSVADDLPFSCACWPSPPLGTTYTTKFEWNSETKILCWFDLNVKKSMQTSFDQFIDGTEIFESLEGREAFDEWIELRKESTLKLTKKSPSKRLGTTSSRPTRVQKPIEGAVRHKPSGRKTRNGTKKGKGRKNEGEPDGQVQISVAMLA